MASFHPSVFVDASSDLLYTGGTRPPTTSCPTEWGWGSAADDEECPETLRSSVFVRVHDPESELRVSEVMATAPISSEELRATSERPRVTGEPEISADAVDELFNAA